MNKRQFLCRSGMLALSTALPSLTAHAQTSLEQAINQRIQQMRGEGRLAGDERSAWLVHDLVANRPLAQININTPLQCASLVKPFVIQAYLLTHYLKDANLYPISQRVQDEMRGMVVASNNEFTNHIFKRLGGPQGVQWMLKKQAPQIFRDIQIVENIPAQGRTYKNRASAADYDRFMRAIWANQLPGAQLLKQLMSIPNPDRIRSKTQYVPQSATVYDKTGSTAMLCGNFGIIECKSGGQSYPYTIAAIIEKSNPAANYASWITSRSNVIREISDIIYLHFANLHRIA
ncbi:MAG: serine hydrolase [Cardiobacteriaceae bacterium]|nr:serine hydrolase [Cardiobacteriaceae bacterium]